MAPLVDVIDALEGCVAALDPDQLHGADATALVGLFNKGSRLCAAGRALVAKRAAQANAWKAEGYRSAEEWLAAETKTTRAAAAESLRTAEQLENLPATRQAFVSGQLSAEQTAAIAEAATADPSAEIDLLREAERSSLVGLRKTSRALVAAARRSQAADRERIHRSRYWKSWTSADGAFEGRFRLTPDDGAVVLAAMDRERDRVFAQARADGRRESSEAHNADAFVEMARTTLEDAMTDCDPSYARGEGDEPDRGSDQGEEDHPTARAPGLDQDGHSDRDGQPVDGGDLDRQGSVEEEGDEGEGADDRVLADSVDESATGTNDCSIGPRPEAELRSSPGEDSSPSGRTGGRQGRTPPHVVHIRVDLGALLRGHTQAGEVCEAVGVGPVPVETAQHALCDAIVRLLNVRGGQVIDICHAGRTIPTKLARALVERDRTCCVPGCDTARHLQNHHLHPINFLGPTSLNNLARICTHHHEQITHQGAQLTGSPGKWTWHPPGTNVPHPVATQWPNRPSASVQSGHESADRDKDGAGGSPPARSKPTPDQPALTLR